MATTLKVSCVGKLRRGAIVDTVNIIGGSEGMQRWRMSQEAAIASIEDGTHQFYVAIAGRSEWIRVATTRAGIKYLKTGLDGDTPDSLLALPPC